MINGIQKLYKSFKGSLNNYKKLEWLYLKTKDDFKSAKINLGQIQSFQNNKISTISNLAEVEFQVFSQGGDDGIIQYLINKIDIPNKTFIEFGVENYTESNTRFLLLNNNWSGYIIDGDSENIRYAEHDIASSYELYLKAAFVTKENINQLLLEPEFDSEVGILSIDIDGNDYWIWEEINVINPVIVIIEYNSVFGINTSWTVPYDPAFVRKEKHVSQLYYGASLTALYDLAQTKGYEFIGCNSKGNNAYFIRKDKVSSFITPKSAREGYVRSKFREARNEKGWITGSDRIKAIKGLDVIDLTTRKTVKIDPEFVKYT